ncbi:MAG: glycosyltransferase family 2 protein, partial [Candidatus Altiarchaeota archaeon]
MIKVSVVIPALNEEGVVGKTVSAVPVDELRKMGLEAEILVVDNASEDGTAIEAQAAGARVVRETKRGYGNAYLRGFAEAKGDVIVILDADGTYPAEEIPAFVAPLIEGKADFVMGSRLRGDIEPGAMPVLHRYLGNPFLTGVLNLLFHAGISDSHCGMRSFTRDAMKKMNLKTPGMEFASEMIIEAAKKKLRIIEVPIKYRIRGGGKPKLSSFEDGWRHLRFMLLYSPTKLYTIPGIALTLTGLAIIFALTSGPVRVGTMFFYTHPMILGNFLVLAGVQIFFLGVLNSVYTATKDMNEPDRLTKAVMKYSSLENGLILGAGLFLLGLLIAAKILYVWITSGFGELSELKN